MSNMIKKSLDPDGQHVSPLGHGAVDIGFEHIEVALLYWPDEMRFKKMVYKASTATRGNDISTDEYDPVVVEDAFRGGLNQCLEWVTVCFEISGVSRGLTHELVRTRKASFAQQSMRHTDMGHAAVRMPSEIANADQVIKDEWQRSIAYSRLTYEKLVDADIPYQDARTVLPIATQTYIVASYPLSEFLNTFAYRACQMFYPEIVYLFNKMRDVLLVECPWLEPYIKISCEKTASSNGNEHMCTYQGWERVEGHCTFAWAKEDNRVWKSRRFEN